MSRTDLRIGVLASGRGSNLQAIIDRLPELPVQISVVISDNPGAVALSRAQQAGIPVCVIERKGRTQAEFELALARVLSNYRVELVVLAGFMRILGRDFLHSAPGPVINIHPSLLPAFPGLHAQAQAVYYGVKVSGCTVHFVDEGVDSGPIIAQHAVPVLAGDDEQSLAGRILEQEHLLLPEVIRLMALGRIVLADNKVRILEERAMPKRALISLSDKTGAVDFARKLVELGYEIVSTGGTYRAITGAGIPATYVTAITGFPEILDGRVKTLHPLVHGGILAKATPEHVAQLEANGIVPIEIVAVNLYPFAQVMAKPEFGLEEAVENIDIGGPAMVRAAAKNFERVTVIVDPQNYGAVLQELKASGAVSRELRLRLASEAFTHTALYDRMISGYFQSLVEGSPYTPVFSLAGVKVQDLRYGENPHQKAAFYRDPGHDQGGLAYGRQLQGKELSYNNLVDMDAAWGLVKEFALPAAVIVKHTNPCGTAVGEDVCQAYLKAYQADPVSAFGGIVALNREVDGDTAREAVKLFLEVIVAPGFSQEALQALAAKQNLRLVVVGDTRAKRKHEIKRIEGGFLVQDVDAAEEQPANWRVVSKLKPTGADLEELAFAMQVCKHAKSNAIVVSKNGHTLGVGAGQMNRVGAAGIALEQAGEQAKGAYLASDAFFPFRDTVDSAAQAGIRAIVQPGGSLKDEESIRAADEHGIILVFSGVRHFKH